ncbi:hypothetical protein [Stagnihabitans tardus]|uniref:Lipoprotein n=1 Tax=Stagnihabitans tardus TaxID=2699202 RepID=A0AAE5BU74_9RHOB|nr:hypothetical protein [Stagnihabitans tardus]NBZ87531.1 hypothetical protein [Stagnihabitans tardus]
MVTTAAQIKTAGRAAMLGVVVFLSAGPAAACSFLTDRWNNLIAFSADGSFVNADSEPGEYGRDTVSGAPVADLGNGLVSQLVREKSGCRVTQYLVVTSCLDGKAISLRGEAPPIVPNTPVIAGVSAYLVEEILAPRGKIRVDGSASIESLTAAAEANDLRYVIKGSEGDRWAPWQHYPMRRACKLFYPGSPGSK